MVIYLIGCVVAFILVLAIRCYENGLNIYDIVSSLICSYLSWLVVAFVLVSLIAMKISQKKLIDNLEI